MAGQKQDKPNDSPEPPNERSGEDEGSAPVEGNDDGLKQDQKPVDR